MESIAKVQNLISDLHQHDKSGHDTEHILRVLALSQSFATQENADPYQTSLIALLHDADDYKIFHKTASEQYPNATKIMRATNLPHDLQAKIISALDTIGYHKRLDGVVPDSLEAKIVSDADMCDALGATGIIRTYAYSAATGRPFFDKNIFPSDDLSSNNYLAAGGGLTGINHFFEKLLRLPQLMLTESGKQEAKNRHKITVDFLYHFFAENQAPEWIEYLSNCLKNNDL